MYIAEEYVLVTEHFYIKTTHSGSRLDRNLECSPTVHLIQGILEIVQLVYIRYHTLDVDLSTIEIRNRSRETVGLREGTNNLPKP
jgi:hypothetical protein